jgi:CheY-like chemotaxis protein
MAPPDLFPQLLEAKGWKVATVNDGPDCQKLQVRMGDAVLIDDDLPKIAGVACISAFRQWEAHHRGSIQKSVCWCAMATYLLPLTRVL